MSKKIHPITCRGNTLYFSFMHRGKKIRSTTGFKVGQEDLAYAAYLKKKKELEDERNGVHSHRTIQEGLIRWIEEKLPSLDSPEVYKSHINIIREFIDETRPLADIYQVTNKMISDMQKATVVDSKTNKKVLRFKNSTINRRRSILSNTATLAYTKWKWLIEPPYKKITRLDEKKLRRKIYIPEDDVEKLLKNCKHELTSEVAFFAAYTGIRTGELWRLNEHSLHGKDLHVDGKGDKLRVIPLDEYQVNFIKNNIPLTVTKTSLKKDFKNARIKCGLLRYQFHDLRHTFGTLMAKAGKPQYKIMKLMGHSSDIMARLYMSLSVDDMRDDMPKPPKRSTKEPEQKVMKNSPDDKPKIPSKPTEKTEPRMLH